MEMLSLKHIRHSYEHLKLHIDMLPMLMRWNQGHRVYHNVTHLETMLDHVASIVDRYNLGHEERFQLELATWYHDAIYIVGSGFNEALSAELARNDLTGRIDDWMVNEIMRMIYDTKTHANPSSFLSRCLCDADLAGLGSSWDEYCVNRDNVRAEYRAVSEEKWTRSRLKFIDAYLNRDLIFHTTWGAPLELKARINLDRERSELLAELETNND